MWLSVSMDTVYSIARDPLFPSFKVGSQYRFWPSEVHSYLHQAADLWSPPTRGKVKRGDVCAHILPTITEIESDSGNTKVSCKR